MTTQRPRARGFVLINRTLLKLAPSRPTPDDWVGQSVMSLGPGHIVRARDNSGRVGIYEAVGFDHAANEGQAQTLYCFQLAWLPVALNFATASVNRVLGAIHRRLRIRGPKMRRRAACVLNLANYSELRILAVPTARLVDDAKDEGVEEQRPSGSPGGPMYG